MGTGPGWCAGYLSLALFSLFRNRLIKFIILALVQKSFSLLFHSRTSVYVSATISRSMGGYPDWQIKNRKFSPRTPFFIFIRASQSNLEAESSCHLDCYYDDVNAMSKSVTSYSVKRKSVAFLEAKKHSNLSKLFLSVHCPRLAIVPTTTGVYVCKATK